MIGIQYRDTFAAKGSELYDALVAKDAVKIKQTYAITSARYYALLAGLSVPKLVIVTEGKGKGMWSIQAPDAKYDNWGNLQPTKETAE